MLRDREGPKIFQNSVVCTTALSLEETVSYKNLEYGISFYLLKAKLSRWSGVPTACNRKSVYQSRAMPRGFCSNVGFQLLAKTLIKVKRVYDGRDKILKRTERRVNLGKLIEENGGMYYPDLLVDKCTHLIASISFHSIS